MQLLVDSMIFGALAGVVVVYFSGALKWNETRSSINERNENDGFHRICYAVCLWFCKKVLQETGDVEALVEGSVALIGGNQMLGAFLMLVIGLLVTMGIGSSFSLPFQLSRRFLFLFA